VGHQILNIGVIFLIFSTGSFALYAIGLALNFGMHVWYCSNYRHDQRFRDDGMSEEDWNVISESLWLVVFWPVYTVLVLITLPSMWKLKQ